MNQKVKKRLEQLIEQGVNLLNTVIQKPSEMLGSIEVFADNGSDLFTQWKHSSRKVLKGLSEDDYHSFVEGEKYKNFDSKPDALRRLVAILKASLDDLNYEILDTNLITPKNEKNQEIQFITIASIIMGIWLTIIMNQQLLRLQI